MNIPHRLRLGLALVLASLVPLDHVGSQPDRACYRADAPATVVLPDGSAHRSGSIRLCLSQRYSPVAALHEVYFDRELQGAFISRVEWRERTAPPVMQFVRAFGGEWVLEGYSVPIGARTAVFHVQWPAAQKGDAWHVGRRRSQASPRVTVELAASPD